MATNGLYGPTVGSSNAYYDPNSSYGSTMYGPGQFATSPLGSSYLEDPSNWDAAFVRYLGGTDPNSAYGTWARSQYPRLQEGYRAALATNPLLTFQQYMSAVPMQQEFQNLAPQQRGEFIGSTVPRARTIARGF